MASNAKNLAEYLNNQTTSATADIADGSITTDKLAADAVTAAKLADNAVVTANITDSAVTSGKVNPAGLNLGRRNIVINGAMKVAQRGISSTGLGAASGYFTLDRFRIASGSNAGRFTMSQSTVTDLPGFANALKLDCTTADTSTDANENLRLQTLFEGQDLQQLKKGTSSAEKFTVSFYVKGNASATYMVEMFDGDNNRNNTQQFAVTSSWNRVSLTFNGDTLGAFDDDNALSLYLTFWLHAGSSFTSGTYTSNTWAHNNNANRAVGISSFFDSTNRTLEITGLQMEVGDSASDFEHLSFQEELMLCKRYFSKIGPINTSDYPTGVAGYTYSTTTSALAHKIGVPMRIDNPALSMPEGFMNIRMSDSSTVSSTISGFNLCKGAQSDSMIVDVTHPSRTAGTLCVLTNGNNPHTFRFDAEL